MLLTSDVMVRKKQIIKLIGGAPQELACMQSRPAVHDRIVKHYGVHFSTACGGWRRTAEVTSEKKQPKSMESWEQRRKYVRKRLNEQWREMGMWKLFSKEEDGETIEFTMSESFGDPGGRVWRI